MKGEAPGLYVGVDVGGTNIGAALVQDAGKVIARGRRSTPRDGSPQDILAAIVKAIEELLYEAGVKPHALTGIGLGVAGVVNPEEGRVVVTPNMNLSGLRIVGPLEKRFRVRTALGNDVDLGTLGESWLGAARGARSAVGIFVGTGIGGGVICAGRLVTGARHAAGEIGHIVMQVGGPLCGCGNKGCLEALASRSAIERDIRDAVAAGRKTVLGDMLGDDLSTIKSNALRKALSREDALVTEVMRRAAETLGYACLTVRHLLDPEVIVLGGGVMEACGDFILPIVRRIWKSDALPGARAGGKVVRSVLGDDAGMLGAVVLVKELAGRAVPAAKVEEEPVYPTIRGTRFGEVTIGKEVYKSDVYIRADGKVKKRDKAAVKRVYGSSHSIGPDELRKVSKGKPAALFIGTGQEGTAALTDEGKKFLEERGIQFKALPTPAAIQEYNKAKGRKAALIHVTC